MFNEAVCGSGWANRSHRGWTTLASFSVQAFLVGVLLVLPLLYPEALPKLKFITSLGTPEPPPARVAPAPRQAAARATSNLAADGHVIQPQSIPRETQQITDASSPIPVGLAQLGVEGGTGHRWSANPVFNSIADASALAPPISTTPVIRHPPVSHAMEAYLVRRVQPEYPPLARTARIQGSVVLWAMISRDGVITDLHVLSGHPLLVRAALAAVQQWRYRPYVLNGEAVEVETQITVNFVLSGG